MHDEGLFTKYYPGDEMKKNEMGGAHGTRGRQEVHTEFSWGNPKEKYHLEDLDVSGRIILK